MVCVLKLRHKTDDLVTAVNGGHVDVQDGTDSMNAVHHLLVFILHLFFVEALLDAIEILAASVTLMQSLNFLLSGVDLLGEDNIFGSELTPFLSHPVELIFEFLCSYIGFAKFLRPQLLLLSVIFCVLIILASIQCIRHLYVRRVKLYPSFVREYFLNLGRVLVLRALQCLIQLLAHFGIALF